MKLYEAASSLLALEECKQLETAAGFRRPTAVRKTEVAVSGDERSLRLLNQATSSAPAVTVPDARLHLHWLTPQVWHAYGLIVREDPDGHAINKEDDTFSRPSHRVGIEVLGGIEPQADTLLSTSDICREGIGLHNVRFSR
ncbi:hypothetical protein KP509_11G011800 [Ceratopteris richardii]|uniref:Uncharacterized protein n=1 Tax=Ceratopteris richardii TaxID=49495 RepID=A0A8T2TRZ1_CERRI|nr:hypothetical protein KP509_11G011800 [Ceratopteris richardii]